MANLDANVYGRSQIPGNRSSTCELRVSGMDCASCADEIRRVLEKFEGVDDVKVDVVGGRVQVSYAEGGKVDRGDISSAIRRIGYQVEEREEKTAAFRVDGMDCADEIRQIEGRLGTYPGVTELQFDLVRRRLVVKGSVASTEVERVISQLGMRAQREGEAIRKLGFWEKRGRLVVTAISGSLLAVGGLLILAEAPRTMYVLFLAAAMIAGGWFIAPRGFRAARSGILDMNFLMTIAAIGAALIGEWGEGASAMFLFSVAQMLEV